MYQPRLMTWRSSSSFARCRIESLGRPGEACARLQVPTLLLEYVIGLLLGALLWGTTPDSMGGKGIPSVADLSIRMGRIFTCRWRRRCLRYREPSNVAAMDHANETEAAFYTVGTARPLEDMLREASPTRSAQSMSEVFTLHPWHNESRWPPICQARVPSTGIFRAR